MNGSRVDWENSALLMAMVVMLALVAALLLLPHEPHYMVEATSTTADNGMPLYYLGSRVYTDEHQCWKAASDLNMSGRFDSAIIFVCAQEGGPW